MKYKTFNSKSLRLVNYIVSNSLVLTNTSEFESYFNHPLFNNPPTNWLPEEEAICDYLGRVECNILEELRELFERFKYRNLNSTNIEFIEDIINKNLNIDDIPEFINLFRYEFMSNEQKELVAQFIDRLKIEIRTEIIKEFYKYDT